LFQASNQLQSSIKLGLIQNPVSFLIKIINHIHGLDPHSAAEQLTEFLSLAKLLLSHLFYISNFIRSTKIEVRKENVCETDDSPSDVLFHLFDLLLKLLKWSLHALEEGYHILSFFFAHAQRK
jgi:hypothetical protein